MSWESPTAPLALEQRSRGAVHTHLVDGEVATVDENVLPFWPSEDGFRGDVHTTRARAEGVLVHAAPHARLLALQTEAQRALPCNPPPPQEALLTVSQLYNILTPRLSDLMVRR